MNFKEFNENVINWSIERGIFQHSNAMAQTLKAVSEIGELSDNVVKGNDISDDIGDVIVCLINVAEFSGINMEDCFDKAWDDIKDRKGKMSKNGVFVKDE